jgi:hypothetical protein
MIKIKKLVDVPTKEDFSRWHRSTRFVHTNSFTIRVDRRIVGLTVRLSKFGDPDEAGYQEIRGYLWVDREREDMFSLWRKFIGLCHPGQGEGYLLISSETEEELRRAINDYYANLPSR